MIAHADPTTSDAALDTEGHEEDAGFGKAIIIGSAIGIVVMIGLIVVALRLLDPSLAWGPIIGISAWTGLWAGLFLGGTVTVGRWSGARH